MDAPDVKPTATVRPRKPAGCRDLRLGPDRPVADLLRRHQAAGVGDVKGRPGCRADPREIAGIAAVVAADHDHRSSGVLAQQRDDGVLAVLRRAADGVERLEARRRARRRRSGRASPLRTSRSISSDSDISIVVWLARPMRCRSRSGSKPGETALPNRSRNASRSPPANVVADDRRFAVVEDHEVVAAVLDGLRGGGLRLLVPDLAVDDRREAAFRVAPDVLPDVQHRSAGRVDERAAAAIELLEHRDRDAERRQDHDVVGDRAARSTPGSSLRKRMPIARSFSLTCGLWMISPVRNTRRSGNRAPRLVGVVDGAIDAVAEAELAGQMDRQAARR